MKKILTTLAASALTIGAFAQGYVNWTGSSVSLIVQTNGAAYSSFVPAGTATLTGTQGNTLLNSSGSTAALGYAGYYYELLTSTTASGAPTTMSGLSAWSDTGLGATGSATFTGRIAQTGGSSDTLVNNWPVSATQAIILVGWSANLGTSWSTVLTDLQNWSTDGSPFTGANAAYFGVSAFGSGVQAVASSLSGNQVIGAGTGEILNNSSGPMLLNELGVTVPEPSTLALAAIGGASLLMFRRKK
jgi:hypothetical protein